jgi:hypothetical protein
MGSSSDLSGCNLITGDGERISLDVIVGNMRRELVVNKELRSRGFDPFQVRSPVRFSVRAERASTVRTFIYEERILEEVRLLADNKPKVIIGVVVVLRSLGHRFAEIGSVDLFDLISQTFPERKVSLVDIKRVLEKVAASSLLQRLVWWRGANISLASAYELYRR